MSEYSSSEQMSPSHVDAGLYIDDFVEMLRDVLRAIAANDATGPLSSASRRLRTLVTYSAHLPPDLNWYKILDASVKKLKPSHVPFNNPLAYEHDYDRLAKCGVKLAAELTTSDGLSTARISKARRAVADEVRAIDNIKELRRELGNDKLKD